MKRLFVVYNPRSSQYRRVEKEVLGRVSELSGYIVGKYAIKKTNFDDNVRTFSKLLRDDDLVIAAGGDATGAIAANAIMKSGKSAILSVLPYGNFNDLAHTLRTLKFDDIFLDDVKVKKLYPLSVYVDGEFWRYATCYATAGMTAECVKLFDTQKVRKSLQKGHKSSWRSYIYLVKWYFRNRRKKAFLPDFTVNGEKKIRKTSDYAAVNGRRMCRVMKGGEDYLRPKIFRSMTGKLVSFPRLFVLMTRSILKRTPGVETDGDVLEFAEPFDVEIQAEGESQVFAGARKIEVRKEKRCLRVIQN